MTSSSARVALAVAAGVLSMALYGGQFVVSRWSIQRTLSPWDLAALRFTVAGVLMLPVLVRHGLGSAAGIGWPRALVLGITVGAPYTLVLFWGLALAPAAHGAVIIPGVTPVISTLLLWLWFGERPWPAKLTGLALIVAGLSLVSWPGMGGEGDRFVRAGDALFVCAGVLWALFTVLARAWRVDPMRGTAVVWVLALAYLPVYGAFAGSRLLAVPHGELVFQAIYQGVGVAIVALFLYARAIRTLGPASASLFMPLIPVFGVLLAVPVLGEVPAPIQLGGMVLVSIGLALAAGVTSRSARERSRGDRHGSAGVRRAVNRRHLLLGLAAVVGTAIEGRELDLYQPEDGRYEIAVAGTGRGEYTLDVSAIDRDGSRQRERQIRGVPITRSAIHRYALDYVAAPGGASTLGGAFQGAAAGAAHARRLLTYASPVAVETRLGPGETRAAVIVFYGEGLVPASFRAALDGVDVTSRFSPTPGGWDLVMPTVRAGSSVLAISAEGRVSSGRLVRSDRFVLRPGAR